MRSSARPASVSPRPRILRAARRQPGDRATAQRRGAAALREHDDRMTPDQQTLPRSTWALLVMLSLGWGCNWPLMKLALAEIPIWTFRGLCVMAGAAGIFAIARVA